MTPAKRWSPVLGWEGYYEVSEMGDVRSIERRGKTQFGERGYGGVVLTPLKTRYPSVNLTAPGRRSQRTIHVLVLESFVGPRPDGMDACHHDGNRGNYALSNLRWDTRRANHADKIRHGTLPLGERVHNSRLNRELVRWIRSVPLAEALQSLPFSQGCIEKAKYGLTWRHIK